jgi:ribonuclease VapC
MIAIDTSALVAYLLGEPEAPRVEAALADNPRRTISAGTLVECAVVARRRGFADPMRRLLDRLGPDVIPVDADAARRIDAAFARWGRGAHPAGLNFGDMFAYDAAVSREAPLLYVGEDFARTDVRPALPQEGTP